MAEVTLFEGTVLRITSVPTGTAEGAAFALAGTGLERGSSFGRPSWIEIDGLDAEVLSGADTTDRKLQGALTDGRFVEVELGAPIPLTGQASVGRIRVPAQRVRFTDYRPPGWGKPAWLFSVLNFKLGDGHRSGAYLVTEAQANGAAKCYRDTTSFTYSGREWFLADVLDGKDDKELRDFKMYWTPVRSAELWTERRAGDVRETIELLARDICNVLSFATGRCVRWLDCAQLDAREQSAGASRYSIWVAAAKDGGNGPVDTGDAEVFQAFMNAACKAVEADPEWWARTLELHLQGGLSPIVDVQLTFYYILLERVSNKVNKGKYQPQIDSGLEAALKREDVKASIEAVFKAITPSWTGDRTRQVVGEVQKWNAEPSMPNRVRMAAVSLGLPEPDTKKVHPRNPMLHEGELSDKLPKDLRHHGDLARAVEALISAMLLRLLGHVGPAYLDDAGRDYLPIHPWPEDRPCPWARA
jgi:hypothetical protein